MTTLHNDHDATAIPEPRSVRRRDDEPRRVRVVPDGPVLVEGPVEVEHDGEWVTYDRFVVAICACRCSRTLPLCDSSHRKLGSRKRNR